MRLPAGGTTECGGAAFSVSIERTATHVHEDVCTIIKLHMRFERTRFDHIEYNCRFKKSQMFSLQDCCNHQSRYLI